MVLPKHRWAALAATALFLLTPTFARALDKQGSAHGGAIAQDDDGSFGVEGALTTGVALWNPSFAARPDNSGLALFRYGAHFDVDLLGRKLSIPLDINAFTDRTRDGTGKITPSELDFIGGLTSTWRVGPMALEIGSRFQHERPVDKGRFDQTFVDTRLRLLYELSAVMPCLDKALGGGDIAGWFTLGWFTINRTYVSRPDNTGLALMRYGAHARVSFWKERLAIGLDATTFTDKTAKNPFRPTELDLTPEIVGRLEPFELHLAYERDMPLDRGGLVQQFVYMLVAWEFDFIHKTPEPLEDRTNVISH